MPMNGFNSSVCSLLYIAVSKSKLQVYWDTGTALNNTKNISTIVNAVSDRYDENGQISSF